MIEIKMTPEELGVLIWRLETARDSPFISSGSPEKSEKLESILKRLREAQAGR